MPIDVGQIEGLYRYPVKSMAGESVDFAELGWHGIEGDRRLALRRTEDHSGFPWLTASKLPDLILFAPLRNDAASDADLPTQVRTPDGHALPVFGNELANEVSRRYGSPVEMLQMRHGIFDDACISVIATDTVQEIARQSGVPADVRRFRPNIAVRLRRAHPFLENEWLGGVLTFGEGEEAPAVAVTMHDIRCSMVNLDPDSAKPTPEVLKTIVRMNHNQAGVYGTVTRTGRIAVGQTIYFHKKDENRSAT